MPRIEGKDLIVGDYYMADNSILFCNTHYCGKDRMIHSYLRTNREALMQVSGAGYLQGHKRVSREEWEKVHNLCLNCTAQAFTDSKVSLLREPHAVPQNPKFPGCGWCGETLAQNFIKGRMVLTCSSHGDNIPVGQAIEGGKVNYTWPNKKG